MSGVRELKAACQAADQKIAETIQLVEHLRQRLALQELSAFIGSVNEDAVKFLQETYYTIDEPLKTASARMQGARNEIQQFQASI